LPAMTRIGDATEGKCDLGLPCCPHGRSGTNASGSPNVFANGRPIHRAGDEGPTNCPHGGTFRSATGSSKVFANGRAVTRVGDRTVCESCGVSGAHSEGSPNVFAGG
jgi:uncharacterized Zn-binding protein involved in type VI secretion